MPRWDNAGPNNEMNLYRMNPDGSGLELLYGAQSHETGTNGDTIQFSQPRQLEDGSIMALIRPFTGTDGGGELITIDTQEPAADRNDQWQVRRSLATASHHCAQLFGM